MASNRIRRLITLVLDRAAANKAEAEAQASLRRATSTKNALSNVTSFFNATVRIAAQAAVAIRGYFKVFEDLTERGGKVLNVQRAFANAVGDQDSAIQLLRKSTRGLIADYDLMVGMNKALTLGAVTTTEQYGELAKTAVVLGRALGIDAAFALETMTLGIGRQSTRVLDNIGLIVKVRKANIDYASALHLNANELTLAQQKEAFRIATMEAARKKLEELGGAEGNNADLLGRLKTAYTNLRDEFGKWLAMNDVAGTFLFEAGNVLETLVLALQSGNMETVKEAFKSVGALLGALFAGSFADAAEGVFKQLTFSKNGVLGSILGGFAGASLGLRVGGLPGALVGGAAGAIGAPFAATGLTNEMGALSKEAYATADAEIIALQALMNQLKASIDARNKANPPKPPKGSPDDPGTQAELEKIEDNRLKLLLQAQELRVIQAGEELEFFQILLKANKALKEGNLTIEERIRMQGRLTGSLGGAVKAIGDPFENDRFGNPRFSPNEPIRFPSSLSPIGISSRYKKAGSLASFFLEGSGNDDKGNRVWGDNFNNIVSAAQAAAAGIQDAFANAFLTIGEKGRIMEDLELERQRRLKDASTEAQRQKVEEWYQIEKKNADDLNGLWETLARGFAASILNGVAQVAATKVAENIAKALGAIGDGLLGNPAGYAAAASYGKAAAAWAAVGGIASAAAGGVSGGGSASAFRAGDTIARGSDSLNRDGGDIIIYLDGVDPNNSRHQRLIGETARQYQQRYGGRVRVQQGSAS